MIDMLQKDCRCPCCGVASDSIHFLCEAGYAVKYRQYECDACGFQFTFPEPTPEEIDAYYTREYYSRGESSDPGMYQDYDKQSEGTVAFWQNWLPDFTTGRGLRLLDVGCAYGRYMSVAESQFGYVCTGVELSDYAREYVKKTYGGRFPVYKTLDVLPAQDKPFDVILLFDVIEHVNSPWKLLWPLFQKGCVGARTRILITTPNVSSSTALADPANWKYRYPPAHLSFCGPKTFAWISQMLLFRTCKVTGHSPYVAQVNGMESFLSRPYAEYDGLFCEFHESTLADLPAETRALDWPMVLASPEYAQLAVGWLQNSLPEPRNLAAEEMLDQSVQRLTAENASLSQDLREANNRLSVAEEKNALVASDWNRIRQQKNGMLADLEEHIAERNNRIHEITGSHAYRIGCWITAPYRAVRRACRIVHSRGGIGRLKCLERRRVHELVSGSVYWDEAWYLATYADVASSGLDPLEHYLRFGWKEGRNPSRSFDTAWYLFRHPAVKESGVCPLVDYLECGLNSGELPSCMEDLPPEEDMQIISDSTLFDADYYVRQLPGGCCVGNPVVHYLKYGWTLGIAPSEGFDPAAYCEMYPDVAACGFAPLLHYLRFGIGEGRILPLHPQGYDLVKQSGLFDEQYYVSLHGAELDGMDPICHYLLKGWRQGFSPSKLFSQEGYMSFYTDLCNINMAPLLHYLRYGKREGRCVFPCAAPKWHFPDGFDRGAFFSCRGKLLVVANQLDHSGVPMLSMRIAALYQRSAAILSPIDGSLLESCLRDGVPVVVDPMFFAKRDGYNDYRQCGFDFCLFNCALLARSFLDTYQHIPSIFWVHDNLGREFMSEDLQRRFSPLRSVYAASSITLQVVRTYAPLASFLPYPVCDRHCTARIEIPKRIRFAVVARIEPRKGQDIAVRAVKSLSPDLKVFAEFHMVGDFVSDTVRQELMHLAQGENIVFHDAVKDQEAYHRLYEDIDVLLCPSRTDPMPLVVLDAMMHGCPVIVSDQVGEKDFVVEGVNGYVFKSEDVKSLCDAMEKMIKARESYPAMSVAVRKTFEENFAATRAKDLITEALSAAKSYCT